jgi:Aerotolerance regulator N-terminal
LYGKKKYFAPQKDYYFYNVNFLYPLFLIAGLALVIPVIIHLFNFKKYKKVLFPDIRFLQELKEQTNKQSQLKHLLVLASRMLAIAALVLAFAQPYFGRNTTIQKGKKASSIFVDNSYSMGIQKQGVPLLEIAKSKAKEIVNAGAGADVFQILSHEFTPNENKFLNKEEALAAINNLKLSNQSRDIKTILQKQNATLLTSDATTKQIIVTSDFQKNKCPLPITNDIETRTFLLPIQTEQYTNVNIDTAYFSEPNISMNNANNLIVRIRNFDNEKSINTTLNLTVNNQIKTVVNISLKPAETAIQRITFNTTQSGWQQIQLHLTDYPVSFDDTFYMAGNVSANYSVLMINDGVNSPYLNAVFKTDNNFKTDIGNSLSLSNKDLNTYSLIVLNNINALNTLSANALNNYVQKGGSVLIFPSASNAVLNQNISALGCGSYGPEDNSATQVSTLNKDHEIVKDIFEKIPDNIDLPKVTKHYPIISGTFSTEQKIMSFSNGEAFLNSYRIGVGKVYMCASAADGQSSNFTNSYWFLPLLFKMAFIGGNNPIYNYTLGSNAHILIKNTKANDNNPFHISNATWDAIPEQKNIGNNIQLNLYQAAKNAGLYSINIPGNNSEKHYVGLNYNRQESDLQYCTSKELKSNFGLKNFEVIDGNINAANAIGQSASGTPIWKICLWLALLFLLIEVLLLRFLK